MTINKNSVEQINVALIDIERQIKKISNEAEIDALTEKVNLISSTLNETKSGLSSGTTYNINISGNAATATFANDAAHASYAETAGNVEHANSADEVDKTWLVNTIYPVGAIYLSVNDVNPGTFLGGTWIAVGSGKVLQGADATHAGGTEIAAGLPNITGEFPGYWKSANPVWSKANNAFKTASGSNNQNNYGTTANSDSIKFDASRSNSIYGNSDTVQPPAFVVYIWKRTE